MTPKIILDRLEQGQTVTYTVRRLRGYLHGDNHLVFQLKDKVIGLDNITKRLRNFSFDEKPYDQPLWTTTTTI